MYGRSELRPGVEHARPLQPREHSLSINTLELIDWRVHLDDWRENRKVQRLWEGDKSLWTNSDEDRWMGWLDIVDQQLADTTHLTALRDDIAQAGFTDALLLGMGGSSMCPEVLARTFGDQPGFPKLHVLDSTDPSQIRTFEDKVDLDHTVFIVASKSGSTLEPDILRAYFYERAGQAGDRFIAITDPGSKLEATAKADGYRKILYGLPSIGGRYSALSNFGMTAGAVAGLDVVGILERAREMAQSCRSSDPTGNPGVELGLFLGAMANGGRNKLTLLTSPGLQAVGAWLEQLIAESTGKQDKAIIPVDLESVGDADDYDDDRVFAVMQLAGEDAPEPPPDHPAAKIVCNSPLDIGQEFFRWEVATAVAGSVMGINPFDQPDVEASKIATRALTDEYESKGSLPAETPFHTEDGVELFADPEHVDMLIGADTLEEFLAAHLGLIGKGDYVALLAYVEMNADHERTLQSIRTAIRDQTRAATCLGFGPRFLHSTGQAYKGGPNQGVVIQITCDDSSNDLAVPGRSYSFGTVKAAQARGDFQVLAERDRRALRVHLHNVDEGLQRLEKIVAKWRGSISEPPA